MSPETIHLADFTRDTENKNAFCKALNRYGIHYTYSRWMTWITLSSTMYPFFNRTDIMGKWVCVWDNSPFIFAGPGTFFKPGVNQYFVGLQRGDKVCGEFEKALITNVSKRFSEEAQKEIETGKPHVFFVNIDTYAGMKELSEALTGVEDKPVPVCRRDRIDNMSEKTDRDTDEKKGAINMIFQQNNDHSNENARQQEIPAAETGNDAPKEEQPLWIRTLIINDCRFISREELDLKTVKNEGTFILQGKQMNFRELPLSFEKEIDDSISFFRDTEDGERVLAVYEDVPIFDSGDAMYNSIHKAYIKCTGNELNALYISNGYYLSKAYIYRDLQPENEKAVKLLRDAGFLND